jgi:hypothetical protein
MGAADYDDAIRGLDPGTGLALSGSPADTPWDPALGARMRDAGVAAHEESLLPTLLRDLL